MFWSKEHDLYINVTKKTKAMLGIAGKRLWKCFVEDPSKLQLSYNSKKIELGSSQKLLRLKFDHDLTYKKLSKRLGLLRHISS